MAFMGCGWVAIAGDNFELEAPMVVVNGDSFICVFFIYLFFLFNFLLFYNFNDFININADM
jgi:hypothetical protein